MASNSTWITVATVAVAVLGAAGAFNSYQVSSTYAQQFPDAYGGERAQIRFAPLAGRVPASAVLGYFTDLDPAQPAYAPAFLAAQYAVAPRALMVLGGKVALDGKSRPELAVGNFSRPLDFAAAGEAHGYAMVADLGNGVVLFRRK